jgi:predicted kinase
MPRLIVLAGLPGTGKSTLARELSRRIGAVWLRIDTIEQAIRACGVIQDDDLKDAGYRAAQAAALDNLRLSRDVIADCVNDIQAVRDGWRQTARAAAAEIAWLEILCTDPTEHRRRVETRISDVPGLALPDWEAVIGREYHAWDRERVVVDTAGRSVEECVEAVLAAL